MRETFARSYGFILAWIEDLQHHQRERGGAGVGTSRRGEAWRFERERVKRGERGGSYDQTRGAEWYGLGGLAWYKSRGIVAVAFEFS